MSGVEPIRRVNATRAAAIEHVLDRRPPHEDDPDPRRKKRPRKPQTPERSEPGHIDVRA